MTKNLRSFSQRPMFNGHKFLISLSIPALKTEDMKPIPKLTGLCNKNTFCSIQEMRGKYNNPEVIYSNTFNLEISSQIKKGLK